MGDTRDANDFWWEKLGDRDYVEDLGLYGQITLKLILRHIQIIQMTPRKQSGKN
jgi:hypothetical protein